MKAFETIVLGCPLRAEIQKLGEGWDISIVGGVKTHVGAVSLAAPDTPVQTAERPGHKDGQVSAAWALRLAKEWSAPVCVRCGIHYDNATKSQIDKILSACGELMEKIIQEERENGQAAF